MRPLVLLAALALAVGGCGLGGSAASEPRDTSPGDSDSWLGELDVEPDPPDAADVSDELPTDVEEPEVTADTADGEDIDPAEDADAGDIDLDDEADVRDGDLPRFRRPGARLFVGAHQDDDLLFMSPDLLGAIRRGGPVRTIVTTAGDACGTRLQHDRELGLRAAYSWMATGEVDVDAWECGTVWIADVPARECGFDLAPISLVNLQLPDCAPALRDLGAGLTATVRTVADPPRDVTESEVLAALREEIAAAVRVDTLDASGVYGHDNTDHEQTARWVFDAAGDTALVEHRCYNVDQEALNVDSSDMNIKWQALALYCERSLEGDAICTRAPGVAFFEWSRRQIPVQRVFGEHDTPFVLRSNAGCLAVSDGVVNVAACGADAARFRLEGPSLVHADGAGALAQSGGVVRIGGPDEATPLSLMANGQLRSLAGRCVSAIAGVVELASCAADGAQVTAEQRWSVSLPDAIATSATFADAEVGSDQRSFAIADAGGGTAEVCVRAVDGLRCAAVAADGMVDSSRLLSAELASAEGWAPLARDATIRFGDLDGDGDADVCARGVAGLLCALRDGDGLSPLGVWSAGNDFSDLSDDAWFEQDRFGSIQLVDVDADGRAEACARLPSGIGCALNVGGGFGPLTLGSSGDFTNEAGWDRPNAGGSLRFGDITGDGFPDVCGRGMLGMFCAVGGGDGTFSRFRFWGYREDLDAARGWPASEPYWATLTLFDLDGDRRADVCMRSPTGLLCGLSNGYSFGPMHPAGYFADADGFESEAHGGSLRLARVGDRLVACARTRDGVICQHE